MKVSKIKEIQFNILNQDNIQKNSVVEITSSEHEINGEQGLFDPRMGVLSRDELCKTDMLTSKKSPGYFGHINLAVPVYNHAHIHVIVDVLNVICHDCTSILVKTDKDFFKIPHPNRLDKLKKLKEQQFKIVDKKRLVECPFCNKRQASKIVVNASLGHKLDLKC